MVKNDSVWAKNKFVIHKHYLSKPSTVYRRRNWREKPFSQEISPNCPSLPWFSMCSCGIFTIDIRLKTIICFCMTGQNIFTPLSIKIKAWSIYFAISAQCITVACKIVRRLLNSVQKWLFSGYGWQPWILIQTQCPP